MRLSTIKVLVKAITDYETNYKGSLKHGYNNIEEFKTDLQNELANKGVSELLEYYNSWIISSNDTNSTHEQRKELEGLVLTLQGADERMPV